MAKDDLFSVLSRQALGAPGAPAPAPRKPSPSESPSRCGAWFQRLQGKTGRDRALLLALGFVVYSVALVGAGIAIGKSRSAASGLREGGGQAPPAASRPDRTIKALELVGPGAADKARAAEQVLRNRFPFPKYKARIFQGSQGRDRYVYIGEFSSSSAEDRKRMEELRGEVAKCWFESGKKKFIGEIVPIP